MTSPSTVIDDWLHEDAGRLVQTVRIPGMQYVDLFHEEATYDQCSVKVRTGTHGILRPSYYQAAHRTTSGAAIRAFGRDKHVQVSCAWPTSADLKQAADELARLFARSAPSAAYPLRTGREEVLGPVGSDDAQSSVGLFEALVDSAFSAHTSVVGVHAILRRHRRCVEVYNGLSEPVFADRYVGDLQVRARVRIQGEVWFGTAFAEEEGNPEALSRRAVEQAITRSQARRLPGGPVPVVTGPGWGGIWLHESLGHSSEADCSPERLRLPTLSPLLTVMDDGRAPGGRASSEFDDEGVATYRTPLAVRGERVGFLVDRYHAQRLGLPLTGNGRRQDFRFLPLPRMTNLVLEAGSSEPEELIRMVPDGIYVTDFTGGRYHPDSDELHLDVREAHRILQGRLQEPVEPVEIIARPSELLALVKGVGDDLRIESGRGTCLKMGQSVPVSVGAPTVLFEPLDIRPL